MDGLPPADRPEVAFAGRSNVGKSSLINALTGRKALARASNTPGRTQEINFFALGDALYLVDLPGYGFAEAPKAAVERWQALMRAYLAGRPTLRRAFLLIDARHGLKPVDDEIMGLLDRSAVTFQVVLTKADKPRGRGARRDRRPRPRDGLARHPAAFPEIVVTSAETGRGLETLRAALAGSGRRRRRSGRVRFTVGRETPPSRAAAIAGRPPPRSPSARRRSAARAPRRRCRASGSRAPRSSRVTQASSRMPVTAPTCTGAGLIAGPPSPAANGASRAASAGSPSRSRPVRQSLLRSQPPIGSIAPAADAVAARRTAVPG